MSGNKKFQELREQYPVFGLRSCVVRMEEAELDLEFVYSAGSDLEFRSKIAISFPEDPGLRDEDMNWLTPFVHSLCLIDMLSYWKAVCSPEIRLNSIAMNNSQADWWRRIYHRGLSEFFYINNVSVAEEELVYLGNEEGERPVAYQECAGDFSGNLIPVGGGKDSALVLNLLSEVKSENTCLLLNPTEAARRVVKMAGYEDSSIITVKRSIDPRLLEANRQGYLNGHTPFSALLAFLALLCALVQKKKYIVLANESSANEGNLEGDSVNHQYSKSFEFEEMFSKYVSDNLCSQVEYFSFLRPLNEAQIAREFAKNVDYLPAFRSCNAGGRQDKWCCCCAKCLFVYIMLLPFVPEEELQSTFGRDLLNDPALQEIFDGLWKPSTLKPLECVGSRAEVTSALDFIWSRYKKEAKELPCLLSEWSVRGQPFEEILTAWNSEHRIPSSLLEILKGRGLYSC